MTNELLALIIISTIGALISLISLLFAASVLRRVLNQRRYRRLDALRAAYRDTISAHLAGGAVLPSVRPGSLDWQAIEDVLLELLNDAGRQRAVLPLFGRLGYVEHYERMLKRRNPIARAAAIDKLGRMQSSSTTEKLIALLDGNDPESVSVTVRALSRIGSPGGLRAVVERIPGLLRSGLITGKALETAVQNFGPSAVPMLLDRHGDNPEPLVAAFVLGVLSRFPADTRAVFLAIERLTSPDPEVRSRGLRVLARAHGNLPAHLPSLVLPLLNDPVWFVRLQAAKAAAALSCEQAAAPLGKLLFDAHWRVRGEAALALAGMGACAVDVYYDALTHFDAYAKEGVCEELERTGFTLRLIEHLADLDEQTRVKAREILSIMRGQGFSSTLAGYVETAEDGRARQAAAEILAGGSGR